MPNWQTTIGGVAGFLSFLCFVPYIITIWQRKTRPNRASWWIWAINGLILSASYYSAGASNTIWALICAVIAQFIIAVLSLKYGEGGWNRFDRACLFGAGISLVLWRQFNSPVIAILLTIVIDFLGALPTLKKSYYEPEKEDLLTWILYVVASLLNLLAIEDWNFAIWVPPLYVFLINTTIVALLLRSNIQVKLTFYKRRKRRKLKKINFM
jgi:ABC-type amino acid transport system permease subunit